MLLFFEYFEENTFEKQQQQYFRLLLQKIVMLRVDKVDVEGLAYNDEGNSGKKEKRYQIILRL